MTLVLLAVSTAIASPRVEGLAGLQGAAHLSPSVRTLNLGAHVGARVASGWVGGDLALGLGLGIAAPTATVTVGLDASRSVTSWWRPAVGVELGSIWGRPLRLLDTDRAQQPYPLAVVIAPRIRLHPLTVTTKRVSVQTLGIAVGPGLGSGGADVHLQLAQLRLPLGRRPQLASPSGS